MQRVFNCLFLILACAYGSTAAQKNSDRVLRWNPSNPECSVVASGGMHHYSISYETLKLTLSVDDNELKKTDRTAEHVFSVLVTVNNRGTQPVQIVPGDIKLEMVEHHHVLTRAVPPDVLAQQIQANADELIYQNEKTLKKHPEKKDAMEVRLKEHQNLVSRWLDFLSTQALRGARVDSGRPELNGWVFFRTQSKWRGNWKDRENFIVRIPIAKRTFEFPFALPAEGMPMLRERGESQP